MKHYNLISVFTLVLLFAVVLSAQDKKKPRPSLHAKVSQTIGVDTEITIDYSRPGVKGRVIWGDLVPYGLAPANKYAPNPYPWRGGANENTTFEVTKDVTINGKKLPAGKYSLHFIPDKEEWTVIFNKVNDAWGSYKYEESKDALRIKVTPVAIPNVEWLEYGFDELAGTSCTVYLAWEKIKIPFKVAVSE